MKLGQFFIIIFLLVVMIGTAIAQGGPVINTQMDEEEFMFRVEESLRRLTS